MLKAGEFINIGTEIVSENQYLGAEGSTYAENGLIYAATNGVIHFDEKNRIVSIKNHAPIKKITPKRGDIVIGKIYSIRKNSVGVKIKTLNDFMVIKVGLIGNIHISNASRTYVESLCDFFQKTDLVRAKVISKMVKEHIISTNGPNLGVIISQCKYCGNEMVRKGRGQIICSFCNHTERKVLASDFGKIEEKINF